MVPAVRASTPAPGSFKPPGPKSAEARTAAKAMPEVRVTGFRGLDTGSLPRDEAGRPMVARVNGTVITAEDLRREIRVGLSEADARDAQRTAALEETLSSAVLERMITVELVREYARACGLRVAESEVDRELANSDTRALPGRKTADLAARRGIGLPTLREQIRTELIVRKAQDHITSSVRVTSADAETVSATRTVRETTAPKIAPGISNRVQSVGRNEEVRASHLVIRCPSGASPEVTSAARARAEKALAEIRAGLPFAEAVRRYSQDALTVPFGGDLGYFSGSRMLPEFDRSAFSLKVGEVSGVVQTRVGFHIILVTERHAGTAYESAQRAARNRAFKDWQKRAMETAKIERFLR